MVHLLTEATNQETMGVTRYGSIYQIDPEDEGSLRHPLLEVYFDLDTNQAKILVNRYKFVL